MLHLTPVYLAQDAQRPFVYCFALIATVDCTCSLDWHRWRRLKQIAHFAIIHRGALRVFCSICQVSLSGWDIALDSRKGVSVQKKSELLCTLHMCKYTLREREGGRAHICTSLKSLPLSCRVHVALSWVRVCRVWGVVWRVSLVGFTSAQGPGRSGRCRTSCKPGLTNHPANHATDHNMFAASVTCEPRGHVARLSS